MITDKLQAILHSGKLHKYPKGQLIYSLDFKEEFHLVHSGYVRRYSVTKVGTRSIEAIYGPGYFFPLTPIFSNLWDYSISREEATYLYEAITDVEINSIANNRLTDALKQDPELYRDILFEAARRLKSNIHRLGNNAYDSDYKKLAHHISFLADEFGQSPQKSLSEDVKIDVPLTNQDFAEQLNVSTESVDAGLAQLMERGIITIKDEFMTILDLDLLKDVYLQ